MTEVFPRKYGRYRLLGVLGAGGMGVVYRAETEPLAGISRTVAIKQVQAGTGSSEDEMMEMLLDEARIWVRLQHPNIVSVVDFGREKHDWFLALELIDGVTAQDLVDSDGKLPVPEALCVIERVARALAYAHALSGDDGRKLRIVHRDVKPANILVSSRGEVKLTDFGIARATSRRAATQAGQVRGSLRVMSPEQVLGEPVDARSDLFSLGCTLHELVTGDPLLTGTRSDVLQALSARKIPPPASGMPPAVRDLVVRLTAAEPAKRPASAEEVARQARAMLLPETVEDVEQALAIRVKRVRAAESGAATADESRDVTARSPGTPDTTTEPRPLPPSQQPTGPAFRELGADATEPLPPGARPARPWERPVSLGPSRDRPLEPPPWQFHLRVAGIAAFALVIAVLGVRWVLSSKSCDVARVDYAHAKTGAGTLAELGERASLCASYCGALPEHRISIASGLFFAGKPSAEAAAGLGRTPTEQRFAATLRVASRGWAAASARNEALALAQTAENGCLAATLAFDTGSTEGIQIPISAVGSPCAETLAMSEALRTNRFDQLDSLARAAGDTKATRLAEAVRYSLDGNATQVMATISDAIRLSGDDVSGVWVPSSFTKISGERGRLTTPLDDLPSIGFVLAGDAYALSGNYRLAHASYQRAVERGWKHPDLYSRQIDLYLFASRVDPGGPFDVPDVGKVAAQLAVEGDGRLAPTDGLAARVAMARLAAKDYDGARKALGNVKDPAIASTVAAEIERRRRSK